MYKESKRFRKVMEFMKNYQCECFHSYDPPLTEIIFIIATEVDRLIEYIDRLEKLITKEEKIKNDM